MCKKTSFSTFFEQFLTVLNRKYLRRILRRENARFLQLMVELGWANDTVLGQMTAAWEDFSHNPDAFYAVARCEVVGGKD